MTRAMDAESLVLLQLERQSMPGDVILQGVRFTDPKNGDVEADFLLLMPGLGAAVIEVKGGLVSYSDGQWNMTGITDPNYRRRIQPIEQARKAKHSLRRYLDRQPEWPLGLIRSAWFVVMPETDVTGDFGPEGLQDQLLGASDVASLRDRFAAVLDRGLLTEVRPTVDNVEDAVSLLLRSDSVSIKHMRRPQQRQTRSGRLPLIGAGIGLVLAAGAGLGLWAWNAGLGGEACTPGYSPCIPESRDVNCSDVGFQVQVQGEDVYGLDADGNGIGCESYPAPDAP